MDGGGGDPFTDGETEAQRSPDTNTISHMWQRVEGELSLGPSPGSPGLKDQMDTSSVGMPFNDHFQGSHCYPPDPTQ